MDQVYAVSASEKTLFSRVPSWRNAENITASFASASQTDNPDVFMWSPMLYCDLTYNTVWLSEQQLCSFTHNIFWECDNIMYTVHRKEKYLQNKSASLANYYIKWNYFPVLRKTDNCLNILKSRVCVWNKTRELKGNLCQLNYERLGWDIAWICEDTVLQMGYVVLLTNKILIPFW